MLTVPKGMEDLTADRFGGLYYKIGERLYRLTVHP